MTGWVQVNYINKS